MGAWNEAVQHLGDRASCEGAKRRGGGGGGGGRGGRASVSIKRDRQRLSGAKRRDRYNRLGSARLCRMENWMRFSRTSVSNIIFRGR